MLNTPYYTTSFCVAFDWMEDIFDEIVEGIPTGLRVQFQNICPQSFLYQEQCRTSRWHKDQLQS